MCWPTRPAPPPRAALRGLETADVRFKDVVAIDGMEDYVEKAAQAL